MVTPTEATRRCLDAIRADTNRLTAADFEAGELAAEYATGYAVCIDGIAAEYAPTAEDATRITRAARHYARIVPLAPCWEKP